MIQELYQNAMKFAGDKHADQKVPGTNANYLLHISNVAMEIMLAHSIQPDFDLGFAIQLAILHDTIEDTDTRYADIQEEFGDIIASGVQALTKDATLVSKAEKMKDSLNRIEQQPREIALVKLADRITNLQTPPDHWTSEKRKNYLEEAKWIANRLSGHHSFLDQRIRAKIKAYEEFLY